MLMYPTKIIFIVIVFFFFRFNARSQSGGNRIQYPRGLKNSFFGINIGYINYPFSAAQLAPGFTVESVSVPHIAPRITLYGYQFNKYLSAQITYMRPVNWVSYKNINGGREAHSVWMNVAGLTVSGQLPLHKKFSVAAEGGLGIITRKGFKINNVPAIRGTAFATFLSGAAMHYYLNSKFDLQISSAWTPQNKKEKQPHTIFFAAGFNYHLKELSKEKVERNNKSGFYFAKHLLQLSYSTSIFGYEPNNLFSKKIPVFWGGAARQQEGIGLHYQRNIFRARKVFSLDWGTGISYWKSKELKDHFFTLSVYPVLRFTAIRSDKKDLFFEYTVAGPTFISKTIIDNENTGKHFTFYDAMGIGMFTGKEKRLNAGLRIAHFSNGNIFPNNNGVKVPLTFSLGYVLN